MLGFKCFGAEHETPRQEFLGGVERKMHNKNVPVKVRPWPEPENEKDRDAIVIDMDRTTGWVCAEYITLPVNEQSICTFYKGKKKEKLLGQV